MKIDHFLKLEEEFKLGDYSICGCHPWIFCRQEIWNYMICSNSMNLGKPDSSEKNLFIIIEDTLKSLFHLHFRLKKSDILILNHERKVLTDDGYQCIYTDWIADAYDNSIILETPFNYGHFTSKKKICYLDWIIYKSAAKAKISRILFKRKFKSIYESIETHFYPALSVIEKEYHVSIDKKFIIEKLALTSLQIPVLYRMINSILSKIQPKLVIEVVYYKNVNMLFNSICKEKKIPAVELQHGTIFSEHAAYQMLSKKVSECPDYILLFSEYWKNSIRLPIEKDNFVPVGFPHFEEKIEEYGITNKSGKTILFISQGTIGAELSKFACQVADMLQEYRVIYKLHPGEFSGWRTQYPWLCNSKIEVIDKKISIYDIFSEVTIQIGAYSTALFEGLGFGLKTIICKLGHYDIFDYLEEKGVVVYADSPKECVDIIHEDSFGKSNFSMWDKNSKSNICSFIDKVITKEKKLQGSE